MCGYMGVYRGIWGYMGVYGGGYAGVYSPTIWGYMEHMGESVGGWRELVNNRVAIVKTCAPGLGCDVHEVFDCLETSPKPMAAASLGQVYKWRLKADGSTVAVKVQRPLMAHSVSLDIYILRRLAHHIRTLTQLITLSRMDHVALVDAWAKGTVRELDYEAEALNQERFKQELGRLFSTNRIYVPSVYHELVSRCVLVSEWVHGPRLADCSPAVVRSLCSVGVECFLAQLLDIGLFHSDPHPGNLMWHTGSFFLN